MSRRPVAAVLFERKGPQTGMRRGKFERFFVAAREVHEDARLAGSYSEQKGGDSRHARTGIDRSLNVCVNAAFYVTIGPWTSDGQVSALVSIRELERPCSEWCA